MYDPFNNGYMYSPLCKREYTDVQPDDVIAETSRLAIRPTEELDDLHVQQQQQQQQQRQLHQSQQQQQQQQQDPFPFKRFKQDELSINYLSTSASSPLGHLDLDVSYIAARLLFAWLYLRLYILVRF